jgi:hypothetical protein
MTDNIPTEPLCGYGSVPQPAPVQVTREDTRTLSRIVLTTATVIGSLMGLVAYWIG